MIQPCICSLISVVPWRLFSKNGALGASASVVIKVLLTHSGLCSGSFVQRWLRRMRMTVQSYVDVIVMVIEAIRN